MSSSSSFTFLLQLLLLLLADIPCITDHCQLILDEYRLCPEPVEVTPPSTAAANHVNHKATTYYPLPERLLVLLKEAREEVGIYHHPTSQLDKRYAIYPAATMSPGKLPGGPPGKGGRILNS